MYDRLIKAILTSPRTIAFVWLAVILACVLIASVEAGNIANGGFLVPGSESARAESLARRHIPSFAGTLVIAALNTARPGGQLSELDAAISPVVKLRSVRVVERVAFSTYSRSGKVAGFISLYFIDLALDYVGTERRVPVIEGIIRKSDSRYLSFALLGEAAASYHYSQAIRQDLTRAELIALPITFGALVVAFLSVIAALLPVLLAVSALTLTLAIVHIISMALGLSVFVVNTASAVALGLSVDYSLIIVSRYREERELGCPSDQAVTRAMQTAGRAVLLSGLTIAAMLPALMAVGIGLFVSIALGGIVASLAAVAAALTLLPAALVLLGDRLERLSLRPAVELARRRAFWRRLARTVTSHPAIAVLCSVAALLLLAAPVRSLRFDFRTTALRAAHSPAIPVERDIASAFGPGATGPVEVVTQDPEQVSAGLRSDPGERTIWRVNEGAGGWSELDVVLRSGPNSSAARETVSRLRREFNTPGAPAALIGGVTAGEMDLSGRIAERLPLVVALALLVALIALITGLKSVVIPLKALACSALSVLATLGLLKVCFPGSKEGSGIAFFVPIVTFVLVLGLSIDYEVFLLSRVREFARPGRSTATAVSRGLSLTARPITLAGLIVTTVFAAFSFSSIVAVKQLGVAVIIGVSLDITLVRWILSPACVVLAGRWNWWLPGRGSSTADAPVPSSTHLR
jgi:RND superfamily putative drug exporter